MKFNEVLNRYLKELDCTARKLSIESGLTRSVISRYKSGERTPIKNSEQYEKLTTALFNIAKEKGKSKFTLDKIVNDFNSTFQNDDFDYTNFSNNLNTLITSLNINTHEMSKYIVFDASHISRIRYGKARPSNPIEFSNKICTYIFNRYKSPDDINNLSAITGCKKSDLANNKFYNTLFAWLTSGTTPVKSKVADFLYNLDSFNLDDYIKVIKFDKLKVPNIPFYKAKSRHYYGLEEMKNGELNFFKATVLSKSKEDIFMCSDMPMEDMAEDTEFGKKWMFGIAMCLKNNSIKVVLSEEGGFPYNSMVGVEDKLFIAKVLSNGSCIEEYNIKTNKTQTLIKFDFNDKTTVGETIRQISADENTIALMMLVKEDADSVKLRVDVYDHNLNYIKSVDVTDISSEPNELRQGISNFQYSNGLFYYENFSSTRFLGEISNNQILKTIETNETFAMALETENNKTKLFYQSFSPNNNYLYLWNMRDKTLLKTEFYADNTKYYIINMTRSSNDDCLITMYYRSNSSGEKLTPRLYYVNLADLKFE